MKLKQVDIENFRAIKNSSIRFHELTAVVGENNSGKTAILRALNSVFNYEYEEQDFQNGVHRYAPRTITKITVFFFFFPRKEYYEDLVDSNDELRICFTYNYSKSAAGRRLYCEKNGITKQLELNFIDKLKTDIDFVYVPANRSSKDTEWNDNSVFARLVTRYLEDYTKNRDTLSQKAISAGDKIQNQVLNKLSNDLTNLNMYDDIGQYHINFRQSIDYKIFLNKLGLEIIDSSEASTLPVSEYGSGIKSLTVITLHRMLAQLNNVSIILGIEEPETNLHPQAQRMLINSLKNSRKSYETQAIFATHSTVIVDALSHDDIVLVRRVSDIKRGFHSEAHQLSDSFWEDHNIKELKHYNFFHYRNSDFFFSRFVILVESITDAQVVEYMLKKELSNKLFYISIVNLDGVESIKYPFFLLKDLGIPFCAVVDKDFFTPYKNGKLDESRNAETFLPEYSGRFSDNKVLRYLFNSRELIDLLENHLTKSYSQFFEFVKEYDLLPMQYCLEMDLVACEKSREKYFDYYNLQGEKRINKSLLIEKKNAIKDPTVIMSIIKELEPKDYPISYKKIRKHLSEKIKKI